MKKEIVYIFIFVFCSFLVNASVVINEIMYNPISGGYSSEYVEIFFDDYVNLSGYTLEDLVADDILTEAKFVNSSYALIVGTGFNYTNINSTVYLCENTQIGNGLHNDGDTITLKNLEGNVVDSVLYDDSWGADGNGKSLELKNPNYNNNISYNWNESLYINGTPGEQNSIFENLDEFASLINLIYPENNSYLNFGDVDFSFEVIDNSESLNCSLYLNNILNQTNETVLNDTLTYFSVLNLGEGSYEWNVTCIDSSDNINSSFNLLNIDLTYPNLNNITEIIDINFMIINFTTDEDTNLTINYGTDLNLTENVSESEFLINHSIKIENLTSSTFYYYNITFCDIANNCNLSETYNFTTSTMVVVPGNGGGPSGGGGGGPSAGALGYVPITDLDNQQIIVYTWTTTYFILNNEQHSLRIKTIENDTLTLTISSEPFDVILKVNETKDVDVDQNGIDDLKITLISIEGFKAVLYFEEIEEVSESEEGLGNVTEAENITESSDLITGAVIADIEPNPLVGGIIIIGIVIVGLVLYFIFKKK